MLVCAGWPLRAEPELSLVANVKWALDAPWFGGFSGMEVSTDGQEMIVVSDRGWMARARMIREGDRLQAIALKDDAPLQYGKGGKLSVPLSDAEGVALDGDGGVYVSFEYEHRVVRLDPENGRTRIFRGHKDFKGFQINSGMEALAVDADGALYTLPERSGAKTRPFPLYALKDGTWQITAQIPRRGPFLPVGADFGPDGRFYLLERTVTPLGFRSRIRRFDLTAPGLEEITLLSTLPGRFDNFEGISLWQGAEGQTFVTLISDDNFLSIQRTQIAEFLLSE